jgi:hypothetical protein
MQPYVIRDGDYLAQLASKFGFDADTVWNDPSNADLQKLRPNPNILFAGDVLQIPDPPSQAPAGTSLTPGSSNSFVSDAPTVSLSVTLAAQDASAYASRAYTIQELDQLTGLQTDGSGVLTFQAPVTLGVATVVFTDTGESWALSIGQLDPINTLSGIFQRLQNLGFVAPPLQFDPTNLDLLRTGLRSLKASQSPDSAPASTSSPASAPGSSPAAADSAPGSSPAAADSAPASAPGLPSDQTEVGGSPVMQSMANQGAPPDSAPASTPAPSSAPASTPAPSSAPASTPAPSSAPASTPAPSSTPASTPAPSSAPPE